MSATTRNITAADEANAEFLASVESQTLALSANVHPAVQYLTALFNPDDLLCLTFIHGTKTLPNGRAVTENIFLPLSEVVTEAGIARLTERNKLWQVYVSMAPFAAGSTRRLKENIARAAHVFAEADANGEEALTAVRSSVAAGEIPTPTIIVQSSPHKYHFIWKVSDFTAPAVEAINRALEQKFHTDSVSDVARVLRIPGFHNLKRRYGAEKPMAVIIESNEPPTQGITITDFNIPLEMKPPAAAPIARPRSEDPLADIVDAISDEILIARIKASDQGAKFGKLMAGENPKGYFAAANSLCAVLAWWTRNNPERIDRLYRLSGLYTDPPTDGGPTGAEWWAESDGEGVTRGAKTINLSCARNEIGSMYTPPKPAEPPKLTSEPFNTSGPSPTLNECVIRSGTADQIIPKKIKWLWKNRFAQKLNMLVGNPDLGKGLITIYTVACVTTGRDWFDTANTFPPSETVVMAGEDDWDDVIVPRLMAAGADLSKVRWLEMAITDGDDSTTRELRLDRDAAKLEEFLVAHPAIRLVIIDPVSNYLGDTKMIEEQKVRADVLMPLKQIANRRQVAIICVMHLNKKVELDAIHRIGGAMAFVGVARMVWLVAPKPSEDGTDSNESLMVKVKGNIVQRNLKGLAFTTKVQAVKIEGDDELIPYVEWVGEVDQTANDVMGKSKVKDNPAHRPAEQLPTCIKWLRGYLRDGAKLLEDIDADGKSLYGFSPKTIQRARDAGEFVTFHSGERLDKTGRSRRIFSCRVRDEDTPQVSADGQTEFSL